MAKSIVAASIREINLLCFILDDNGSRLGLDTHCRPELKRDFEYCEDGVGVLGRRQKLDQERRDYEKVLQLKIINLIMRNVGFPWAWRKVDRVSSYTWIP